MLDARTLKIFSLLSPEQREYARKGLIARGVDPAKLAAIGLVEPQPTLMGRVGEAVGRAGEAVATVAGMPLRGWGALGQVAGGLLRPSDMAETINRAAEVAKGEERPPGAAPAPIGEKVGKFAGEMAATWPVWGRVMGLPLFTQRVLAGAALSAAEQKLLRPKAKAKEIIPGATIGGIAAGVLPARIIQRIQKYLSRGKVSGAIPWGEKIEKSLASGRLKQILPPQAAKSLQQALEHKWDIQGYWTKQAKKFEPKVLTPPEQVDRQAAVIASSITGGALSPRTAVKYLTDLSASKMRITPEEMAKTFSSRLANAEPEVSNAAIVAFREAAVSIPGRAKKGMPPLMMKVPASVEMNKFVRTVKSLHPDANPGEIMDDIINKYLHPERALVTEPGFSKFQRSNVPFHTSHKVTAVLNMMNANFRYFMRIAGNYVEQRGYPVKWGKKAGVELPEEFKSRFHKWQPFAKTKGELYQHYAPPDTEAVKILREYKGPDQNLHDSFMNEMVRVLDDVDKGEIVATRLYRPYMRKDMLVKAMVTKATSDVRKMFPRFWDNRTMQSWLGDVLENRSELVKGVLTPVRDIVKQKFGQNTLDEMAHFGSYVRLNMTKQLPGINRILVKYGKNPILLRPDYIPHMHEMNAMTKLFGTLSKAPKDWSPFIKPHTGMFPFALRRVGDYFVEDPMTAYLTWMQSAHRLRYMTHTAEKFNNTIAAGLLDHPEYRDNLTIKVDALRGIRNAKEEGKQVTDFINSPVGNFLREITNDNVQNIIVGHLSTILNQSGSFPILLGTCRPSSVLRAIIDLWNPVTRAAVYETMMKKSYNLQSRQFAGHEFFGRGVQEMKGIPKLMGQLLSAVDTEISAISFAAGMRDGAARGLQGEYLAYYADKIAAIVNRLYIASESPRALRNRLTTMFAPLQGYIFNGYNFLTRDLLRGKMVTGLNTRAQRLEAGAKFLAAAYVTNSIFQMMGIKPPLSKGDFIPVLRGGRYAQSTFIPITGEVSLLPIRTLLDLGSGIGNIMAGDFDRGINQAARAALLTIPRGGGLQLWRMIMKGEMLPTEIKSTGK